MRPPRNALAIAGLVASVLLPLTAAADPAWLALAPGTLARVDVAPWPVFDEPEAALTASPESLERDFSADLARPNDVVYEPVGVRVRVVRVLPAHGVALVRGVGAAWEGYAPIDRMFPEVPAGTRLRAAGGFAGFADFFPALDTPVARADQLPTGSELTVLGMGAAPYDPGTADLVRVHVRVETGPSRGRTGWVSAGYTGVPVPRVPATAEEAVKACVCRIVRFEGRIAGAPMSARHSR